MKTLESRLVKTLTFALLCAGVFCARELPAATLTWDGGGTSNNWGDSGNWNPTGTPTNGDTLIFPAAQPRLNNTNNIASLTLNQIRFAGASGGYAIHGNSFTLTNSILATNSAGLNLISNNITLGAPGNILVDVATGAKFVFGGTLSGSAGLLKTGGGTNELAGGFSNTYLGTTTITNGLLELFKAGAQAAAIPHDLVIGNNLTACTVRNLAGAEIADVANVTVNRLSTWDLNTHSETISNLTLSGGSVTTGTGTLTLGGDITSEASIATSSISGFLSLGSATRTIFTVPGSASPDLLISAVISGGAGAGINKLGVGQLTLTGTNTYTGPTTVSGFLIVSNDFALGANGSATNGTTISQTGFLLVESNVGNEFLTLSNLSDFRSFGTASWDGPITLNGDAFINVFGSTFTLTNAITGTGGITKGQSGTLIYAGSTANTYSGDTIVNGGILQLSKTLATAGIVNGTLTIGDDVGGTDADVVRETLANQINSSVPITINSSGLLDLNNVSDAIGALTFNGGHLTTGTGTATLTGNVTANASTNNFALMEGKVSIAATRTFNVADGDFSPDLTVSATISGAGGITKTGTGEMRLSSSNSYSGLTTVSGGFLRVEDSFALGSTNAGTVVNSGGCLSLLFDVHVGLEPLSLSGPGNLGIFGALHSDLGSNSWAGAITLATDSTISVFTNRFLNLLGPISGADGIIKIGPGTLIFSGSTANSYTGSTFVNAGSLLLNKSAPSGALQGPLIIGDNLGGGLADVVRSLAANQIFLGVDVTVNGSGLLDLNGFTEGFENVTIIGGNIDTGSGMLILKNNMLASSDSIGGTPVISGNFQLPTTRTITVTNGPSTSDLTIQAAVSGAGFAKNGTGFMILSQSNSFTGSVTINDGILELTDDFAAGTAVGGVTVNSNGSLRLSSNIHVGAEALTLNSTNFSGAFESIAGSNSWAGNITLATNTIINVDAGDKLNLPGAISGLGSLTKIASGTLIFSGSSPNSYTNMTTVATGTLVLSKPGVNGAVVGELTIGDGAGGANADVVQLTTGSQIANNTLIHINSSGLLDLNSVTETTGSIDGSGQIDLGSGGTLQAGNDGGTSTFTGLIVGTGSLFKFGAGMWTITGNNTFTGTTTVSAGTLIVNGSQPQSPVTVNGTATLGGNGTVGNVLVLGNLAPGTSPGILTCSNLIFSSSSDYFVELTGPTAGLDYDQMNIRGTNSLSNAVLQVTANFTKPVAVGQQFVILNNDGADAVAGTFNGLPNGSAITANGYTFTITYGNDVTLTLATVPAADGGASVTAGNGNHAIDPNDCNDLAIVITNKSGIPMTGVSAYLSSSNDSVLITQPFSGYPNVSVGGRATNSTSFQISTLPNFGCGTNINLTMTIFSTSHGDFTFPVVLHSGEPGSTPTRYDNSTITNISDVGTIESTNVVAGFGGPITRVAVSLYLTHTFDGDLNISLINPDGISVDLTSGNGSSGDDYGTNCVPDAGRTTFDDSAGTAITAGSSPFIGTFRPEVPLTNLIGATANGNWRLHITDANGGSLGALRCWSLFLYPTVCAPGSGYCLTCPGVISNSIAASDPTFTNRLFTSSVASSCAAPKSCPGVNSAPGPFHFDAFTFTNTGPDTCVSVGLDTACGSMFAAAYLNSFDTNNLCANYLADIGANPATRNSFSFGVAAGDKFVVIVHAGANATCASYRLVVSGLPCPAPTLAIEPTAIAQTVRLDWTTAAGGFNLESNRSLTLSNNWTTVTNEPVVSGGRYSVTNSAPPTNRFYRLRKP